MSHHFCAREDRFRMTNILLPPFLQPGDTVDLVATARWIENDPLSRAIDMLRLWGLNPRIHPNVFTTCFQLAGDPQVRRNAFQETMDARDSKAVIIVRGGYGTVQILDGLDLSRFLQRPKWVCGYSDVTALHAHIYRNTGCASIHSTMPVSFPVATPEALHCLKSALLGEPLHFEWPDVGEDSLVNAPIVGGNLSVLYSLIGSRSFPDHLPHILFIEDVDEMLYHIDRMLTGLYRAGAFRNTKAFLLGGFTQMKDNTPEFGFATDNPWGCSPQDMVKEWGKRLGIPVFTGFPAGHMNDNRAFFLGFPASLKRNENKASLTFQTTQQV